MLCPRALIKLTSFTTVLATWSSGNTDLHKDSWWMMQRRTIKSKLGLSSLTRSWFLCSSLMFCPISFVSGHVQQCSPLQVQSLRASWYSILCLTGLIAMDSMARNSSTILNLSFIPQMKISSLVVSLTSVLTLGTLEIHIKSSAIFDNSADSSSSIDSTYWALS